MIPLMPHYLRTPSLCGDGRLSQTQGLGHVTQTRETHLQTFAAGSEGWRGGLGEADEARAAGSVPANIVEGSGHDSRKEFARFLRYAAASAAELEEHITLAVDVGALYRWHVAPALKRNTENRKMLRGLIKRIDPDTDEDINAS